MKIRLIITTLIFVTSHFCGLYQNRYPIPKEDKWGYIDVYGEEVIEPQFESLAYFHNGYAVINGDSVIVIDTSNSIIASFPNPDINIMYLHEFSEGLFAES